VTSSRFVQSVAANLAFWSEHAALTDPHAWPALDRERENLFRAVEFGLRQDETWSVATDLALNCFTYVFERGYWSEWTPVLELALYKCPDDCSVVKGYLLHKLGSLCRKLRRLDDAQAAHSQAEALGRALNDPILIAESKLGLGRVYRRRHQYDLAERYARQALLEFEAWGAPPDKLAHTQNLLGIIALGRGDYENSAKALYQASDLFRQAHEPIELARTMLNLCLTLGRLGRAAEALELAGEAATIFTDYDLHLERSRLNVQLGLLHYNEGDLALAEAAFRQAYSPAMRRAGPLYERSMIEMNLGNALLQQGHTDESQDYFLSAVAGFRVVNARTMLANSLDGLAEISLATGHHREAVALYEEALAIVSAIPEDAFANRMEQRFVGLLEQLNSPTEEEE